jgi:putative hydrolase of the HAD superfamily
LGDVVLHDIRWVLFDAVGTLIYPAPPVAEVYFELAQRFGSRLSVVEIRQRFGAALVANSSVPAPTNESLEHERWQRIVAAVIDDAPDSIEVVFEQLWRHFSQPQHWRLYADVPAALAALAQRGLRLGIASNFDGRLKTIVHGHPALAACDAVFVSSEIGYSKPDPRFFQGVEERLGVLPAQIALIGDDEVADVQGATSAGWRAIRIDRAGESGTGLRTLAELV